jgi:beta-mannanase
VFFCYNHEPENDGSRGTPAEYRAAWKHVSDILASEKATNVVKVLIIMGYKDVDDYYPGDSVVDWIGGDPYNWAYSNNNPTAKWSEFDTVVKHFYTWASKYNKPLMLGETGCNEDAADPTRRAKWIAGMAASAKKLPLLKAVCYFNYKSATSNDFYINTPEALAAFKAMGQDPYYLVH